MSVLSAMGLVLDLAAAALPWRLPSPPRGVRPPAPRPRWWETTLAVVVFVQALPIFWFGVWLMRAAVALADDDFLFILGLLLLPLAALGLVLALSLVAGAITIARMLLAHDPAGRWFALAFGGMGVVVAGQLIWIGTPGHQMFVLFAAAGLAAALVAVLAPPVEDADGSLPPPGRLPSKV